MWTGSCRTTTMWSGKLTRTPPPSTRMPSGHRASADFSGNELNTGLVATTVALGIVDAAAGVTGTNAAAIPATSVAVPAATRLHRLVITPPNKFGTGYEALPGSDSQPFGACI
ncbi:hypothetical protein Vau01_113270 [Virgisporangium aurantiacum]|uniref:Uncharacterized protein n=1 Tax=Virgisporangium aurantiacum TaxID=175570 RepID=A0A8J3ZHA5_9ACTN|nr:hypothetical protein Vau01_113270 [Virgisporangium aurantiacum]